MNKIKKLHLNSLQSNKDARKQLCVNNFGTSRLEEEISEQSAKITKDIAIKFRKWFNDNNYEFVDNTIVGDLYANRRGSDSALTETEIFNIFIETL